MSIDMYVSASQTQASSTSRMCRQQIEGYQEVQRAINDFTLNAPFLTGKAYDSAKAYFSSVLLPLSKGGTLLSEAVERAVKKFPEEYMSQVDSGDLKQSELEEKIRQANRLLGQAEEIRYMLQSSKTPDITKGYQLNANMFLINMYADVKRKLEEKLRKLLQFNAVSPSIFAEIASLQQAVNQGLAQTKSSWNTSTGTFTVPSDLSWRNTVNEKWNNYQDTLHGIDKKKNKELEKYNVYAVILMDADGNPKISWQIEDKTTGYGVTNPSLYRYLSKTGKYLDSDLIQFMSYEAFDSKIKNGWRNGVNYVTGEKYNKALGGIVSGSQYIEDGYTWLTESELGQAIQILGFTYAVYKVTTTSGTKQVSDGKIEKASGAKSSLKYKDAYFEGSSKVGGVQKDISRKVHQLENIDFNRVDEATGLTNLELMKKGRAPIWEDGSKIELHHMLQMEPGPMAELPSSLHDKYHSVLHGLVENGNSFRNNAELAKQYNNFRSQYWKWRAIQIK